MSNTHSIFHEYGTDRQAEQEGLWSSEFRGDVAMKLRSMQSKHVKAAQDRITKRNLRYIKTGAAVPADVQEKNEIELAVAIVADWRGDDLVDRDGATLGCDDETKHAVFAELWELRQQVIGMAASAETFRVADREDVAKNSSGGSAPRSTSATG